MNNFWLDRKEEKTEQPSTTRAADYAYQRSCLKRNENTRLWLEERVDEACKWLLPSFQKRVGSGFDHSLRGFVYCLALHGDLFLERVCSPKDGKLIMVTILPPETVFRIQTTKGNLLEFQQSSSGPDYAALARGPIDRTVEWDREATAIRFKPEEIVHVRRAPYNVGGYGTSFLTACSFDSVNYLVAQRGPKNPPKAIDLLYATVLNQIDRMTGD